MALSPWFSVLLLGLLNMCTMWDRYSTAGVLRSIQSFYGVSDSTGGLLQTSFVVVYLLTALPLFYLGDRFNRKVIVLVAMWLWLVFVVTAAFIPSHMFWLFLSLRSLAAIADSTVIIIGPSIIADLFAGRARGFALAFFYLFLSVGISIGLIVGTILTSSHMAWQWSIGVSPIVALPVLLLSHFFLFVPSRGASEGTSFSTGHSVLEDLKSISTIKTFWFVVGALCCFNFQNRASAWWQTTVLELAIASSNGTAGYSGIGLPQIQTAMSSIGIGAGVVASPLLVLLASRWGSGEWPCLPSLSSSRSSLLVAAFGGSIALPSHIIYLLYTQWNIVITLVFSAVGAVANAALMPLSLEAIMNVSSPQHRVASCALLSLMQSLTGDGPAPFIVGLVSDALKGAATDDSSHFHALLTALLLTSLVSVGTCIFLVAASISYPREKWTPSVEDKNDNLI